MSGSKKDDDDLVELHIESTNPADPNREIPIDTNEKLSLLIESVARNACLPRIDSGENEPLEHKNLEPYAKTVEKSLTILNVILDKFQRKQIKAIKQLDPIERCAVLNLLLLCGEHQYIQLECTGDRPYEERWVGAINKTVRRSSVWITEETNQLSTELLSKLEHMTRKTIPELINLYGDMCLRKLSKQGADTKQWSVHLATTHCYLWILVHMEETQLPSILQELKVMQFVAKIFSHHSSEYKMKALLIYLSLLSTMSDKDIVNNIEWDKLLHLLKHSLYHSEIELTLPATHCIVKLMEAQKNLRPQRRETMLVDYDWTLIDDVRDILISFIETSKPPVQSAYMDAFSILIDFTRVSSIRWHFPLMQILKRSIPTREVHVSMLHLLEIYLLNTWPFIRYYSEQYCAYLFKILMEASEESETWVYRCFYLIKTACADTASDDHRLDVFLSEVRAQVRNRKILKLIDTEFDEAEMRHVYEDRYFAFETEGEEEESKEGKTED